MDIFKNNLTFAVIGKQGSWRTDITVRYAQHLSHKLHAQKFSNFVHIFDSIDQALTACTTDYLLVQAAGNIIFSEQFLLDAQASAAANLDIVVGLLQVEKDYVTLDPSCFLVNIPLWTGSGSPKYVSNLREGPILKTIDRDERGTVRQIITDYSDRVFVNSECGAQGAELIIRQLEKYGRVHTLHSIIKPQDYFMLDSSTPYAEIHNETLFEKRYLAPARAAVPTNSGSPVTAPPQTSAQVLVTPAHGLRPLLLAQKFSAKKIIIYANNQQALDFQRKIFSVKGAYLYSEIVEDFFKDTACEHELGELGDIAVYPLKDIEVEFVIADACSFEMEELLNNIDDQLSAIFDFSDAYVDPHNFYRRPLYQVQALFAQIYSLIKSRRGPSRIVGMAPGFLNLDEIDINTCERQFDPAVIKQYQSAGNNVAALPDMFFKPPTSVAEQEICTEFRNI